MADAILLMYQPATWIIITVLGFVTLIINGLILHKEWKARKTMTTAFTTKYLKIYSTLSIVCGTLFGLILSVSCFSIFCYVGAQLTSNLLVLQSVFMGIYQLERLRYCFSQSQVHSNKGYPNYVFIIMYTVGIMYTIYMIMNQWLILTPSHCGINNQYQLVRKLPSVFSLYSFLNGIGAMVYLLWDGISLLLYLCKVFSFRKYKTINEEIYNRIMSILNRILILTITYQIAGMSFVFANVLIVVGIADASSIRPVVRYASSVLISIVMNLSMHLMQEHNKDKYKNFLFIIHKFKLHFICCCCCKSVINEEICTLLNEQQSVINTNQGGKLKQEKNDSTTWETIQISRIGGIELSVATTTNI